MSWIPLSDGGSASADCLFVVLLIAIIAVTSSAADTTASVSKVVTYYTNDKNAGYVSGFLLEAAVLVGLSYFWYLRTVLIDGGADVRLTTLGSALFLVATSTAIVKSGALAKWLGWVGIVLGVVSLTAVLGPLPAGIRVLVTSITLLASRAFEPSQGSTVATV